jgi:hypothetical protein
VSLRDRLERLEAKAKPQQPPPRSERRERAFERLFRTLEKLRSLLEREEPRSWEDPRVQEIVQRHQEENRKEYASE